MEITYTVLYHEAVLEEDIPKLPPDVASRVKRAIEERLMAHPEVYGKPLRRSLRGYRKLRVGDYRVIFCIQESRIKIFVIAHRSHVYRMASKRVLL